MITALFDCEDATRARVIGLLQPFGELLAGTQGGGNIESPLKVFGTTLLEIIRRP